ncbi:MAG: hypothetical protein HY512_00900 [Candidatus Aenigmarchaeota archaeon]|nr:hypothetical protein [Candidatus Aenigmarchaeota archaeon]
MGDKNQSFSGLYVLLAFAIGMLAFNQYLILGSGSQTTQTTGNFIVSQPVQSIQPAQQQSQASQAELQAVLDKVIPKGVPGVYGTELKVSFDDPVNSLDILANLDADLNPGKGGIKFEELTQIQKDRYLKIGFSIACEFCCGVQSLITKDGQPSCSCAHSAGMRGLAKYLLKNHESEFTDEQILDHLTKWKTLFFPQQMVAKYMQEQGMSVSGLPKQVGGC